MKSRFIDCLGLLLLPCQLLAQSPAVTVPLEPVDTYLIKAYSQVGTNQTTDFAGFKGIPDYLVEKVIRYANTVRGQSQFEAYQQGKVTAEEWKKNRANLGRDTVGLSPTPIRHRINTLVGTDRQGHRVVIVDANSNCDFSDDRVLTYPMAVPIPINEKGHYTNAINAVCDTLPAVQVQLEAFDGRRVVPRTAWVKPNPYNSGWTYQDPVQNQFHLSLLAHEYRKGTTILGGQRVYFTVKSGTAGLPYNAQATTVEIRQTEETTTQSWPRTNEYKVGDSFILNNRRIQIQDISVLGDKLQLADVGSAGNTISRPADR
ncbi:hypothetical protein [Fibrivirga algicola]|uniref:Uncharacterized protein n=1 Tax=Fibrivirga algicola TaxID=2950420 RepID=A0ABX0QCK9_9BACT|nr:hypothetical protein [Fibrivirga algicola]NID08672.1 hypothetical protein [Fibrivirga algicola]